MKKIYYPQNILKNYINNYSYWSVACLNRSCHFYHKFVILSDYPSGKIIHGGLHLSKINLQKDYGITNWVDK